MAKAKPEAKDAIMVAAPNLQRAKVRVYGTAPYVQHKFSQKAKEAILDTQQKTKGTSRKSKEPRDIEADYLGALHVGTTGKYGIPAAAFRSCCISACRVAGLVMTRAKLSVFCEQDDIDAEDGTPLVIIHGKPERHTGPVRLESGITSIAIRPMWREWYADVSLKWDGDQFSRTDIVNLLERGGQQVGIGEGRADSKKSHGTGWGFFSVHKPS